MLSLAERLKQTRRSQIVGRAAERDVLRQLLQSETLPANILYVHGPGGVGKTTLLNEYGALCAELGVPSVYLDLRNIETSPDGLLSALKRAVGDVPSVIAALAAHDGHYVLLLDTFELAAPLDAWLRTIFLPQLSANVLCVFASQDALPITWRDDPGWAALIRVVALRNLNPDDSRAFLARRAVPEHAQDAVLKFTRGHPLALSLVADSYAQHGGFNFDPDQTLDVVKALIARFIQRTPAPEHRAALELCALVRLTTESLLAAAFPDRDAHALFDWLRSLSFIDAHRDGLFPHDLARDALTADLRWRNPDWYVELHNRARGYYTARLGQSSPAEQQRLLYDYIFLHRDNPVLQPFFEWQASGGLIMTPMQPDDYPVVKGMITKHEGDESAAIAKVWLSRKPGGVYVCRDFAGNLAGFMMLLPLHEVAREGSAFDPAVDATWRYLNQHAPLRAGEIATLFRFWMADEGYQGVSSVQSLVFVNAVRHYLTTPGLAFTFFPVAEPDFWSPAFAYASIARLPGADFAVEGRRYGVFGNDWRTLPPVAWLSLLAEREIGREPTLPVQTALSPLVVLSYEDFVDAVRQALRDFTRLDLLRLNPLLHSRVITDHVPLKAGDAEQAQALQALIREAAGGMQASGRLNKAYRCLYHTYLQPAETQEAAAELLDLPFSTYRRHLKTGIDFVLAALWNLELQGADRQG